MGSRRAGAAWPQRALPPGRRWFHGKISGHEAVQQLQPPEDGLFLVRESARHPGDYVLCVSFGRDVIHYRVLHRDGHLTIDEAVCFCNLMDMVEVWPPQAPPPSGPGTPPLHPATEPHGLHRGGRGTRTPATPSTRFRELLGPGHPKLPAQSQCGKEQLFPADHQPCSWSGSPGPPLGRIWGASSGHP